MTGITAIRRHEIAQAILVHVSLPLQFRIDLVVFDVDPSNTLPHGAVLFKDPCHVHVLGAEIATVEDQAQMRVIHTAVQFLQQPPTLPYQIGLDLQTEVHARLGTGVCDTAQTRRGLIEVVFGSHSFGMVEGETSDQLGIERLRQFDRPCHLPLQVAVEGDEGVGCTVIDVEEFDFANR